MWSGGVGFGNPAALLADHDGEFGFPVDRVGFLRQGQVIVRADQGFLVLGEQGGELGDFPAHFLDVVAVVVAHADDLAGGGDDGVEVRAFERVRGAVGVLRGRFPVLCAEQLSDVGEAVDLGQGVAVLAHGLGCRVVPGAEGEESHSFLRPSM